jgi:lipocalin
MPLRHSHSVLSAQSGCVSSTSHGASHANLAVTHSHIGLTALHATSVVKRNWHWSWHLLAVTFQAHIGLVRQSARPDRNTQWVLQRSADVSQRQPGSLSHCCCAGWAKTHFCVQLVLS